MVLGDDERIFQLDRGCVPTDPTIRYHFSRQGGAAGNGRPWERGKGRDRREEIERRTGDYIVVAALAKGGLE